MSHTPNELSDLFPDQADTIHNLKENNAHFAKIADEYHQLNREIHRAETDIEPLSDEHLEELKKKRLALSDEIQKILSEAA